MEKKDSELLDFLKVFVPGFLIVVGLFAYYAKLQLSLPREYEKYGKVPSFQLQESGGNLFESSKLSGRIWLASFILTKCPGPCPLETHYLKELQDKFKDRPDFNIISCTVDPENDTPAMLAKYADKLGADRSKWFFLSGTKTDLYTLAQKGFKVTAGEDRSTDIPEFIHTTRVVLVDRNGEIRGYYDSLNPEDQKKLEADLEIFLSSKVRG